jgi:benzoate/toluate 1,2-dioxygenase alpha subunit
MDNNIGSWGTDAGSNLDRLVDDRLQEGIFRVHRSIYNDPRLFEREIACIFESNWVFLCHESQVREHGDYVATQIARQPVFVIRKKTGDLGCYINACSHRGALLTPHQEGRATTLTCRFHGWCYNTDGACIKIKDEDSGWRPDRFNRAHFDLKPIARLDTYRGFVFGSLVPDISTLNEYLGGAARFLDFFVDQSEQGLEVLPGWCRYIVNGNWKVQLENGPDGYHVSTVHRVFANTMARREEREGASGTSRTESGRIRGRIKSGGYDLGHGHMATWAQRIPPDTTPLWKSKADLERRLSPARIEWSLLRGRNLVIFPNLQVGDLASTQLRSFRPLSAGKVEITLRCIAPVGEPEEARRLRLRKFEDFFMPTGMANSDDVVAHEDTQAGSYGTASPWTDLTRGLHAMTLGADDSAKEGDFMPVTSNSSWDSETPFHSMYRYWRSSLEKTGPTSAT